MESKTRYGDIDFRKTRAVSDEMNYAATLRLNMPKSSTEERAKAVQELEALLLGWVVDGHRPIRGIATRETLYEGPCVKDSPDIIIELNLRDGYSYTLLPSARVPKGTTWRKLEPEEYPGGKGLGMNGTHRQFGVLGLWGAGVAPGAVVEAGMPDIAPTLLHLMGESIPAHMDGDVLVGALRDTQEPVLAAPSPHVRAPASASDSEAAAIRDRLERLGYL